MALKQIMAVTLALVLTACGGGSDTSGGGGSDTGGTTSGTTQTNNETNNTQPSNTQPSAPTAGITYVGTGTVTLIAPDLPPITDSAEVTIIRNGSTVTAIVDGESVSTTINGDSFEVNIPVSESRDGITCAGAAVISGTFTDTTVNASLQGSGNCLGQNLNVPLTVTGSLTAQAR
jgi:hypothetical protein